MASKLESSGNQAEIKRNPTVIKRKSSASKHFQRINRQKNSSVPPETRQNTVTLIPVATSIAFSSS
jgi:hypothetical protein